MELGLSLGGGESKPFDFLADNNNNNKQSWMKKKKKKKGSLDFCMGLENDYEEISDDDDDLRLNLASSHDERTGLRVPGEEVSRTGLDVNRVQGEEVSSSAAAHANNSMGIRMERNNNNNNFIKKKKKKKKREFENDAVEGERGSDDDEARKKLRLSKHQSAFLELTFKQHNTLNPKQKLALAKQLNLRPRQVEVWFQNRRARRKLKQTEVDCEYLKRCCETLSDENRRLHKELRLLKQTTTTTTTTSCALPATTLTICPSCMRHHY